MIILLTGVVCFVAAWVVARRGADRARDDVRGAGAAAWMALLALLVVAQLALGRGALDGYRLTLLGFRFSLALDDPSGTELVVGGDYESSDLWAPGAGDRPAARLRAGPRGDVEAVPGEDATAVALVEEPGLLGAGWRVLGGRPVDSGDTVSVRGPAGTHRLVAATIPDTLILGGLRLPLPWVREHVIRGVEGGGMGPDAARLPGVERGLLARLRPYHPSVFQRTYPLSDVLAALDPGAGEALPALSSFFYYREGTLHLADLDSEVGVVGGRSAPDGEASPEADVAAGVDPQGAPAGLAVPPGRRLLVAGLPLRDYPEPDLVLPERYGVRPLRAFRLGRNGSWLEAALTAPETRSLDRAALEELRLPEARTADGAEVYRIRLAPARDVLARRAVVFDASPERFAVPGQAVLSLPVEPTDGTMEVLTPAGLAGWETGRPLALGTGDRRLLVRVDGQGTSAGFWWGHLVLLGLPVLLFLTRPMTGPVFALALTAAGLASLRMILSLSAMAAPPHVMEAQQLGLWLLPYLPWAVVVAGEAGRSLASPGKGGPGDARGGPRPGFHGGYALVLVGLAAVLFPESRVKAAALSLLALATAGVWLAVVRGALEPGAIRRWWADRAASRGWVPSWLRGSWVRGWRLGLVLLAGRAVLEVLGFREQITVAGTRIGMSVLYTPLVVAALAAVLVRAQGQLRRAWGGERFPAVVAATLLDVGAFLLLALVGASAWISDFGIALALLPGTLALLALVGAWWAPPGRRGVLTVATLALPLALFSLVQVAPPLLRFAWGGGLQAVDARMGEWNRNELLLLERGDPVGLRMIGQRRSEALAVMRETMRSYTRGNLGGKGFLEGRVSEAVAETATREHTVSALLASQFGLPGALGLTLLLLALLPPGLELLLSGDRRPPGGGSAARGAVFLGVALAVLVPAAFLLPSPFNALLVGLSVLVAVAALTAPAFGGQGAWSVAAGSGRRGEAGVEDSGWEEGAGGGPGPGWSRGGGAEEAGPNGEGPDGEGPRDLPFRRVLAASALLTVAGAGLYMVLANYGLVFFTGKNVYGLGLDSLGDALEATVLLALAAVALGAEARTEGRGAGTSGTDLEPVGGEWWHPSDEDEERVNPEGTPPGAPRGSGERPGHGRGVGRRERP